jgi:methionyl-tRNA synthetase
MDGTYSEDDLVEKLNSDLANDLGNFVSRTLAMIVKYNNGEVPATGTDTELRKSLKN